MAKQKEENLGTFIKKHPSGMLETNKGEKSFQGNIGDVFMRGEDGKTFIVAKESVGKETKAEKAAREAAEKAEADRILAEEEEAARIAAENAANEGAE